VSRQTLALVVGAVCVGLALLASASGWLGGVIVCGADRAPGCVAWPALVATLLWLALIVGVVALVVWQFHYLDR
jgi:hypothetical protein